MADISASGAVLHQDIQVSEILKFLEDAILMDKSTGIPLVFCPRRQIACERARNQDAIYIVQMDLRFDLAEIWKSLESKNEGSDAIVLKLILPKGTERETTDWLESEGVNEAFIYPDFDDECPKPTQKTARLISSVPASIRNCTNSEYSLKWLGAR